MRAVWTITAKDLRQRVRDGSALLLAFVVPFGLAGLFSLLFGGLADGALGRVELAVVDRDHGPVSSAFTDQYLPVVTTFLAGQGTDLVPTPYPSVADARTAVEDGTAGAAFVLPDGLSTGLEAATPVEIEVLTSADNGLAGDVAVALAEQFVQQARGRLAAQVLGEGLSMSPEEAAELAEGAATVQGRIRLDRNATPGRVLDWSTYLAAGMAVFFLFFTVQYGVLGYLEERTGGTLPRLLASPIAHWQVLAAKALTSLVVGVVSVGALMVAAIPTLGASWGDPVGVVILVVTVVLAATTLVAVVGAVARTAEQAQVWQSVLAIVLGMLGGAFFPIERGTGLLSTLSLATPHAWFLRGLSDLAGGGGPGVVVVPVAAMLVFAVAVGTVGLVLARREVAT